MNIHIPPLDIKLADKDIFEGKTVANCELLQLKSQLHHATYTVIGKFLLVKYICLGKFVIAYLTGVMVPFELSV